MGYFGSASPLVLPYTAFTTGQTITGAFTGNNIILNGLAGDLYPVVTAAQAGKGAYFRIMVTSTGFQQLQRTGSDFFLQSDGLTTDIFLNAGEAVELVSNGVDRWVNFGRAYTGNVQISRGGSNAGSENDARKNLLIPYSQTQALSSNTTLTASDAGKTFICTGTNTHTLPSMANFVTNAFMAKFQQSGAGITTIQTTGGQSIFQGATNLGTSTTVTGNGVTITIQADLVNSGYRLV